MSSVFGEGTECGLSLRWNRETSAVAASSNVVSDDVVGVADHEDSSVISARNCSGGLIE